MQPMSHEELLSLPTVISVVEAGRALGFERTHAYRLAREDRFPVPVLKIGASYRVPKAALLDLLGVDAASHLDTTPTLTGSSEGTIRRLIRPRTFDFSIMPTIRTRQGRVPIDPDRIYNMGGYRVTGVDLLSQPGNRPGDYPH